MLTYRRRWIDAQEQLRRWLDPRIPLVRVTDIQNYLLRRDWKPVPSDRPHTLVFMEPGPVDDAGPLYQFVPASEQFDNYAQQVFELISALAVIEDRPAVAVLDDILSTPGRIPPNGTSAGSSPAPELSGT